MKVYPICRYYEEGAIVVLDSEEAAKAWLSKYDPKRKWNFYEILTVKTIEDVEAGNCKELED